MEKKQSEIDTILNSIKEREKEQFELLSLARKLAPIYQTSDLELFIKNNLKDNLHFDQFIIGATNELEKEYKIVFCDNPNLFQTIKEDSFLVNDGIFDSVLQSPEIVKFNANDITKRNKIPSFITNGFESGTKEIIAFPLEFQKNNPSVLFLFYKNPSYFDRNSHKLLKSINSQLSITITNIIVRNNNQQSVTIEKKTENSKQNSSDKNQNATTIIGSSLPTQKINNLINIVATSESSVLIEGESGTGKELVAQAIHKLSTFKNKKMVIVNCGAIPENLIESELFGHEKGSFTGATELRIGKFELANNSTLFLDEIGELSLELQTKLLRVLQEKEIERIGGKKSIKVNVRIIAATNRNLQTEVQEKRFRADLFYRLNVFPILIPPLRDRKEDIPELCSYFLSKFSLKSNRQNVVLSAKAMTTLTNYPWPGNIRELEHCIERSVLLSDGKIINEVVLSQSGNSENATISEEFKVKSLKEIEKEYILKVVKMCNGRISGVNGAAVKLQIPSTTLISKMQKLGIKKEHFSNQ